MSAATAATALRVRCSPSGSTRFAISAALKPEERAVWQADIDALRAVPRTHTAFRGPDRERPQHYLDGMTAAEFRAIQSMATRFQQEVQLSCEQKYGDIARKKDGETSAGQAQFEANLRAKMVETVDPANPYRFMTWLSNDDQMAIGTQFATQAATYMATCTQN